MIEYAIRRKVSGLPVQLVTVDQFRSTVEILGDKFMVILEPVSGGGYVFRAEPIYQPAKAFQIRSERSRHPRVFKTVEAALRIARSYGFSNVQVELKPSSYPQAVQSL